MPDKNIFTSAKKSDIIKVLNEIKLLNNSDILFIKCLDGKLAIKTKNRIVSDIVEG